MRLSGITPESFVDGPGLRFVIFTQGCLHCCPKCHNPESWDVSAGKEFTVKEIIRMIKKNRKAVQGVTFSGGEPFLQAGELAQVALAARQINWDIVTYTGFTYEELIEQENSETTALLSASDILIDGKYIHKNRTVKQPFCGSTNQRIISIAETQKTGKVVLWEQKKFNQKLIFP
ncbi:MAG: anaerobic ribonucleoside-triphosphate reductase activating protein [Treponema sp.]|nr:anaerobic ribonucleoside-triphosphate reductase activating protein [Treponema sp.]MCL2272485.1 anaerobic ribonucleoside-triphosphate reductase activating protein [Treponema sp.]